MFYSDLRNAGSLEPTKYYCINFHCGTVTMLIKLSSYVTWSTSETVASVQLPLNAVFFCLAEVVSHVILQRQHSRSIITYYYTCKLCQLNHLLSLFPPHHFLLNGYHGNNKLTGQGTCTLSTSALYLYDQTTETITYASLGTRPSENRKEGLGDRLG